MKTLKETSPDIHSRRRGKPTSSLIYTRPKQNPGEESLGTFQGRLGAQTAQCKLSFSEELPALGLPLTDAASPRAGAEEATQRLKVAGTLENNHSPTTRTATLPPSGKVHQKAQETETRTQAALKPDRLPSTTAATTTSAASFFTASLCPSSVPSHKMAAAQLRAQPPTRTLIGCPRKQDAPLPTYRTARRFRPPFDI